MNSSSPGVREDVLIEAVRTIKSQRQRPSLDRISRWLRFHKQLRRLDPNVISSTLDAAVQKGALRKDVKDGSDAYFEFKKSTASRERRIGAKLSIASAICQCIQQFGGSEGLALDRICERVSKMVVFQDMDPLVLKYHVRVHCLKAVKRGKLLREGRCYSLVRSGQVRWNSDDRKGSDVDLSFLVDHAVTNKRPVTPIKICSLCLDADEKNRNEPAEELVYCVECGRGGHPGCLKFSSSLAEKVKTMRWQCIECKRCSVCSDSSRGHLMLFCDSCDRGFHMDCCRPPIRKRPRGIWICCICDYEMDHNNSLRCQGNTVHQSGGNKRKCINGAIRKPGSNRSGSFPVKRRNSLTNSSTDFGSEDSNSESDECAAQKTLPFPVSKDDEDCYRLAQLKVSQKLVEEHQLLTNDGTTVPEVTKGTGPLKIEFGKYEVTTWYSSPYPDGYTKLSKLYICEYCLRYMESRMILERHLTKCLLLRPPGDEIYRDGNLSVFEVDGNVAQTYCQNLCLLAKLFLDHKTLYYDVEPFLFYILTLNDGDGCHLVGYFSKEKYCVQKYNLSCIMVLPQYQRHGYGRLLIDFSYLLSRVEGRTGTPEKPLSDLGQLTYQSYWKEAITAYLERHVNETVTIKGISDGTGICEQDVVAMLQLLNLLVAVDQNRVAIVMEGVVPVNPVGPPGEEERTRTGRVALNPVRLQWKPFVSRSMVQMEESETFQELKELSRLVDDIRDDRQRQAELLSPSIRLSRSGSLCKSPPCKRRRMSSLPLPNGSCSPPDQRIGLWQSKSETVGSPPAEALPLTSSTPLASERLGVWRTRRGTLALSPIPDAQDNKEASSDSLKAGAEGKRTEWGGLLPGSLGSSTLGGPTKPGRRRRRGWVKGRKRGTRPRDLTTDLESAETSDAATADRGHDLREESLVIVIHSSVEQVVDVSAEDQTSDMTSVEKSSPQESTEIYAVDRTDRVVGKDGVEEFVVDGSMEVEKIAKVDVTEGSTRVVDGSVEMARDVVMLSGGGLSDAWSYSRVDIDSEDLDEDVKFEPPSLMSDSDAGISIVGISVADVREFPVVVSSPGESACAAGMLNGFLEGKDEVVDGVKKNVKGQVIGEEEANEEMCQVADNTGQQDTTPVDEKCQAVADLCQNEVNIGVGVGISQQEAPGSGEKCSFFVVESTNSDVGIAVDQSENFHCCDSLPENTKDPNSQQTELPQMAFATISGCSSTNKYNSYDRDGFSGKIENGNNSESDDTDSARSRLSEESNERGPLPKESKSSLLHTNQNEKRDSIKMENGKRCPTLFPGRWNGEPFTAGDSKREILNGCLPDYSSMNNIGDVKIKRDGCEELGRSDENARKLLVEIDCILSGKNDFGEDARIVTVEVDCVNNSIELKELTENARKLLVENDCVLNGNAEIKELTENYTRNSVNCILNGNAELKEDGERARNSVDPSECLETLACDSLSCYQNCNMVKTELVTAVCLAVNGVEKELVSDSVVAKKIKTIELTNCCKNSVDDR